MNTIVSSGRRREFLLHSPADIADEVRLPLVLVHGLNDPLVPFARNPKARHGFALPSVQDWATSYARANGCDEPETVEQGDARILRFGGGPRRDVTLLAVASGGHAWPGGKPQYRWVTGHTALQPNATELLWRFFRELPSATV